MSKKRILIITAVFPPEQVTSAFLNYDLVHELAKEYDVTVDMPGGQVSGIRARGTGQWHQKSILV